MISALLAALAYGVSDFLGGFAARRDRAMHVAVLAQLAALVPTCGLALAARPFPAGSALFWGTIAGFSISVGAVVLYRGLATGAMGVVAPLSAVVGAGLPLTVGLALGEQLQPAAVAGIAIALPAVAMVASTGLPGDAAKRWSLRDIGYGAVAGSGWGLSYICYGAADGTDAWPVAVSFLVSAIVIAALAFVTTRRVLPGALRVPVASGVAAGIACILFRDAATSGSVALASVLASLYPGVTVLLATVSLREPLGWLRGLGLALTLVSVALLAS